ncbi:MAG: tetratricopeptide repeat protein [Desulfobacteraceae bacterium]|nr:MAG: tetratricopeptide repeat protein [Desulfobacteraceae bacterium]
MKQGRETYQGFSHAVCLNPDNMKAQLKMGQTFLLGGKTGEAREKAELALKKSRDNIEALGFAQIAKEEMPKNVAVMDTLDRIYYLKGSYMNAIAEFQDSLAQDPNNPVINYHLGLAYYKSKQPDKAKEFLDNALRIDQNFKGAEEARSILKEIRDSSFFIVALYHNIPSKKSIW